MFSRRTKMPIYILIRWQRHLFITFCRKQYWTIMYATVFASVYRWYLCAVRGTIYGPLSMCNVCTRNNNGTNNERMTQNVLCLSSKDHIPKYRDGERDRCSGRWSSKVWFSDWWQCDLWYERYEWKHASKDVLCWWKAFGCVETYSICGVEEEAKKFK